MAQLPSAIDIENRRGDDHVREFTVRDGLGNVVDITGFTFFLAVNKEREPTGTTNQITVLTGTIFGAPTNGKVRYTPDATLRDAAPDTYYYDAQLVDLAALKRTFAAGKWIQRQDVTKA